MPRESVALVIFMGLGLGMFWGLFALELWMRDESVAPVLIVPVWLTVTIGAHVAVQPIALGVLVSAALGLVFALAILGFARMRGW